MSKSVYRVDTIPVWWRPFYLILMWALALAARVYLLFVRATSRVEISGKGAEAMKQTAIECIWHETLPIYFVLNVRYPKPYAWMNHPLWYMKPIHIQLRLMGVRRLALGSSGHSGKAALEQLVKWVQDGDSTLIAADGPAGPPFVLKSGVLDLSQRTGKPVLALRLSAKRERRHQASWDKKRWPLPFNTLYVEVDQPRVVTEANRSEVETEIVRFLNGEK